MQQTELIDEVKWGILGTGDVAEFKGGPPLYDIDHSSVVAVMSRKEEKVKSYAERHGVAKYYTDVKSLIEDPEVNAIYIATPPNVHRAQVEHAARCGKHILLEKPMAPTVEDCRYMNDIGRKHGVQIIVAYYRRFFPVVQKIKELLDRGAIGRPIRARALLTDFYQPREDGERAWLTDYAISAGGFMMDAGIHRLDLFSHFFGAAKDVSAYTDTVHFNFEPGVDDSSTVIIRFMNGVHATAEFNWNIGLPLDEFEISGTEGRIFSRNLGAGELEIVNTSGTETFQLPPPTYTHQNLVSHFVHCLRTGEQNVLSGEAGMVASQICLAAYESSRTRKVVSVME